MEQLLHSVDECFGFPDELLDEQFGSNNRQAGSFAEKLEMLAVVYDCKAATVNAARFSQVADGLAELIKRNASEEHRCFVRQIDGETYLFVGLTQTPGDVYVVLFHVSSPHHGWRRTASRSSSSVIES